MGLITGYETIKSNAYYHFSFEIEGNEFVMSKGAGSSQEALNIARTLIEKGIDPQISRTIHYNTTRSGYLTKDPEHEDLTMEKLEVIASTNEALPEYDEPIVHSTYRC